MKIISEHQKVGDGLGWFIIRNLYQTETGNRVSIPLTHTIECTKQNNELTDEELLKRHAL